MPSFYRFRLYSFLCAAVLAACSPGNGGMAADAPDGCRAGMLDERSDEGFAQAVICVGEGDAAHRLTVEMAETRSEQERGLMHRTALDADRGMLFPFSYPRAASFWMKNTVIPLDMIFIDESGRIESIIANVPPLTLEPRRSQGVIAAVLELRAGRAAELGLKAGDRVVWPH